MQNCAKSTSRGENGEIKNEYFIKEKATYVLGPKPNTKKKKKKKKNNNNKQAKICAGDQALEIGAEGEEGNWASAGVFGSPE